MSGVACIGTDVSATLRNVTIVDNVGPVAGGYFSGPSSTSILFNTLIANNYANPAKTVHLDINGAISSSSYNNLVGVDTSLTGITNGTNGNQIGTASTPIDPLTGPLGLYGGSNDLPVVPLIDGSPAIDTGANAYVSATYDQRGSPYLRIYSDSGPATVDIGAFEAQPFIPPCYLGTSILRVREYKTGEIKYLQAKDVYATDHEVYDLDKGMFIPVLYNAVMKGAETVYRIPKDLLDNGPSEDLFITSGHPICIDGKAVKARDIEGAERTDIEKSDIYSIITKHWTPIDVNGIGVYAWSEHKWFNRVQEEGIVWVDNLLDE